MTLIQNIKLGSDPEFFLRSKDTKEFYPSVGLIGGSKEDPIYITDRGHAIQEDNVMVEFNIPPCDNAEDFAKEIQFVPQYIKDKVLPNDLEVVIVASAHFNEGYLQSEQAKLMGCDPDFNAWELRMNKPGDPSGTLRTAGGHIHVGYDDPNEDTNLDIIKAMDLFLGVPSILMDTDTERRKMYGKAGCFRFKRYGVEYRTLSNFWIATEDLSKWAFNATMKALEFVNNKSKFSSEDADLIQMCINECDKELAELLIEKYSLSILAPVVNVELIAEQV